MIVTYPPPYVLFKFLLPLGISPTIASGSQLLEFGFHLGFGFWMHSELAFAFQMQREHRIGTLVVDTKPIQNADKQTVIGILCEAIKEDGLSMLDWNEQVLRLQQRVASVKKNGFLR